VPSCRVRVTVLPHPCHSEWADLSMELLCYRSFEAVESGALMVLHALSTHRPQEMLQTSLGLVPTLDPNDPLWLGRMANIATLLEIVPPYDTVRTLGTCLRVCTLYRTFVELSRMTWQVVSLEPHGTSTGLSVSTRSSAIVLYRLCRPLLISRGRYYSYRLSEVTTCSRFWTYRLGNKRCSLKWLIGMLRGLCTFSTSRSCSSRFRTSSSI
jgi:hypothetical protein